MQNDPALAAALKERLLTGTSQIPIDLTYGEARALLQNLTSTTTHRYLSVNCRDGFYDPDSSGRCHVGTWPEHMRRFVRQGKFQVWGQLLLQELARLQSSPGQPPNVVHILLWCNKGTHRSVSASRVLEAVADKCRWPSPAQQMRQ